MSSKKPSTIVVGAICVLAGVVLVIVVHVILLAGHQVLMSNKKDETRLNIIDYRYANYGIALLVHSKSDIMEIKKQQKVLFRPYKPIEYKTFKTKEKDKCLVLAKYGFEPKKEWYLELLNEGGLWISISPFFGNSAEISSQQWKTLWNHDGKEVVRINDIFPNEKRDNPKAPVKTETENGNVLK